MMTIPRTLPRSFLYVPATKRELFPKAARGPADALVLDLEDAVPLTHKDIARGFARSWLDEAPPTGTECWVRVNADAIDRDLDAVVRPGLVGLFLAKCTLSGVQELSAELSRLEAARGMARGSVRVVGLVESAQGLVDVGPITRCSRLTTLGLGEVDLLADLRISRTHRSSAAIDRMRADVVLHCAAAGLSAPVAPTSTSFRDLDAFAESTRHMHDLGYRSRTAIHPAQVPVIHEVLTPTDAAVAAAEALVARFDAAGGGVATDEEGRLVDAAVVREARETLARGTPDARR